MLNPSRVEVAAPDPVILVPTYIALVTDKPPERTTAAVVKLEASVELVNVTKPFAAKVVNAPLDRVLLPIGVLLIVPPEIVRSSAM